MLGIQSVVDLVGELQRDYIFKTVLENYPTALLDDYENAKPIIDGLDCVAMNGIWPERSNENIKLEWGGENVNFSGVDNSKKDGEIVFITDQKAKVCDFFEACKDLTGTRENNVVTPRENSRLTLGCYLVSVDKETVNDYRQLKYVKVDKVTPEPLKKDGKGLWKIRVSITWDFVGYDKTKRGKKI